MSGPEFTQPLLKVKLVRFALQDTEDEVSDWENDEAGKTKKTEVGKEDLVIRTRKDRAKDEADDLLKTDEATKEFTGKEKKTWITRKTAFMDQCFLGFNEQEAEKARERFTEMDEMLVQSVVADEGQFEVTEEDMDKADKKLIYIDGAENPTELVKVRLTRFRLKLFFLSGHSVFAGFEETVWGKSDARTSCSRLVKRKSGHSISGIVIFNSGHSVSEYSHRLETQPRRSDSGRQTSRPNAKKTPNQRRRLLREIGGQAVR